MSFQFRNLDRVVVTFDAGGDVQSITWVTGGGVVVYYGSYTVVGPLGTERWFSAPGQAYSKFRWYTNQQNSKVLERYRRDGWVTRYELRPGTTDAYRPERVFDPGDNEYTYSYYPTGTGGGIDHRIKQIKDWRGTEANFAWPSATHCVISCRRQSLDFPGLTWEFELDAQGRLALIRLPATTYHEASSGPLLDLTQPRTDRRIVTVDYHAYSSGQALVKDVKTHRAVDLSDQVSVLHCEYVLAAGRYRIQQQTDRLGGVHSFTYTASPVIPSLLVKSVYTAPGGTQWEDILDADGRPTTTTVIPTDDANGRPRAWGGDEAEPQALSWHFSYGACACPLPASITHPSGFTETMTWDADTGHLLIATVPSPTGTGTETEARTYAAFLDGARPVSFLPPAGEASVTYAYQWMNRSGDLAGRRPTEWTVSTSAVVRADGQSLSMASTVYLDGRGRVDAIVGVDGTVFDYQYGAIGTPYQDLFYRMVRAPGQGAYEAELKYTRNELGWVTQVESGPVGKRTVVVHELDPQGRVWRTSTAASSGATPYVTEVYRDWFENIAVQRTSNVGHDGQAPRYADGTGGARAFVRREWNYAFERVVESWMDRRALPAGDDLANPTQIPDPWMARYVFQYDASGLPSLVTLPNGSRIRYTHDGYATLYKVEAEKAANTWIELGRQYFDADLMPRKTKQLVEGSTFASTLIRRNHGGQGYPFEFEDPTGKVTTLAFDAHGRVLTAELRASATAPAGARTTLQRDELGRVRKAWRHEVDSSGNSVQQHEWRTLYDVRGNTERVEGPLGRVAHYAYDEIGRLSKVRDNLSSVAADCNEVELVWEAGRDVPWKQIRRVFEETSDTVPPTGVRKDYVTELDHDLLGRLVARRVKGLDGQQPELTWAYAYDAFGQATKVTDAEGRHSFGTFDAAGRWVEAWRDAASGTPSRIRLSAEYVDAKAGSLETEIAQRDGRGFETRSVYDGAHRLVATRRPGYGGGAAHVQTQTYDDASRPKTITDGNGSVVTRLYDLAGRLLFNVAQPGAGVSHLATAERFEYDELGRLKDARTDQTMSHLLLGSVAFARDGLGRVSSETFTYFNGQVSSSAQVTSGYQFDNDGQITDDPLQRRRLTYPSGLALETKPDAIGRRKVLSVATGLPGMNTGPLTTWQYAAEQVMRRTTQLGASTQQVTDHGYDAYRRLTTLQDAVGTSVVSAAFAWDKVGNLTKEWSARVDGTVGERFSYDDFGRMTAAKVGVLTSGDMDVEPFATAAAKRTVGYGIDAGNNWSTLTETLLNQTPQTTTYTTTDSPRYVQISTGGASVAPTYDGEGNLTYDGTHYLVYDFKNRLSEVWRLAVEGTAQVQSGTFVAPDEMRAGRRRVLDNVFERERGVERDHQALKRQGRLKTQVAASGAAQSASLELVALYGYDPFNRRLLRIVTGSGEQTGLDQRFAYDGWREVEEFAADGEGLTSTKAFVWGNRIDELLAYHRRELGSSTWQSYYPVQGRLDSVCALRDASGAVVERVEYDLYGRASVYVGTSTVPQTSSSVGNPHLYTGRRLDGETGFVYLRNRYLHTGMGRFLTVDPIGSWGDQAGMGNGYAYAGNSPATFSDPSGRSVLPWYDGPINLPPGIMAAAGPGDRSDDACQDSGQRWAIWLEWNSGEEMPGHMSLAIGDPNGEYVSYSFYAADEIGAIIGGPGEVRVDTIHGGVIERDSFHWITEHDARAIRVSLGVMAQAYRKLPAEQKHGYCAHYYNCRWWSRKQLGHILRYLAADPARGGAGRPGRRGSPPAPRSAGPGGIGAAIGVVVGAGAIRFSRAIRGGGFILAYDAWAVIAEVNSLWSY